MKKIKVRVSVTEQYPVYYIDDDDFCWDYEISLTERQLKFVKNAQKCDEIAHRILYKKVDEAEEKKVKSRL